MLVTGLANSYPLFVAPYEALLRTAQPISSCFSSLRKDFWCSHRPLSSRCRSARDYMRSQHNISRSYQASRARFHEVRQTFLLCCATPSLPPKPSKRFTADSHNIRSRTRKVRAGSPAVISVICNLESHLLTLPFPETGLVCTAEMSCRPLRLSSMSCIL